MAIQNSTLHIRGFSMLSQRNSMLCFSIPSALEKTAAVDSLASILVRSFHHERERLKCVKFHSLRVLPGRVLLPFLPFQSQARGRELIGATIRVKNVAVEWRMLALEENEQTLQAIAQQNQVVCYMTQLIRSRTNKLKK